MLTALGALAASSLHVVWADQRLVVFGHGVLTAVQGPGLVFVLPGVERGVRVPAGHAEQLTTRSVPRKRSTTSGGRHDHFGFRATGGCHEST
jgi:regulator of protease activity HflC (stomatin/prohibitin superfamily)